MVSVVVLTTSSCTEPPSPLSFGNFPVRHYRIVSGAEKQEEEEEEETLFVNGMVTVCAF